MKKGLYCIVHAVRERTELSQMAMGIRDLLHAKGVSLRQPKMGLHMTAIPPFWTDEGNAKLLAWGFDYWDSALIGQTQENRENFKVWGVGFDFFRNPGEGEAFILKLSISDVLARAIERGRKKIPDIAKWKYPPENYDLNPHITLGEGEKGRDIYTPINRFLQDGTIRSKKATEIVYYLDAPRVLRKNEEEGGKWQPVA